MSVVRQVEVEIAAPGARLRGTLALPGEPGPSEQGRVAAALLIAGSGELDRNSDHRKLPLGVTRLLAEALADVGVASLRYDKRGVGASSGAFLETGLSDNVADAGAALASLGARPEVDPARLLVVGHSEGAFIAAGVVGGAGSTGLAATGPEAAHADVAGVALLPGAAHTGEETLRWKARAILPTLPHAVRGLLRVLRVDVTKKQQRTLERLRATTGDVERVGLRRYNARWWREFLDMDPARLLAHIDAPVLALTGAKDVQAPPEDVAVIGERVAGHFEGHVVDDVNHILRFEPGTPSLRNYRKQSAAPLDPRVTAIVTDWARRVTTPSSTADATTT